jgi:hypothetical protein
MSQSRTDDPGTETSDAPGLSVHAKALQVNLDPKIYGTFAEIGGGQEVSRWFFRVGGAAGTVAKAISAYDMQMSDAIYGPCDRYVSRRRLADMLVHEYDLLEQRLREPRGKETCFFVFADTVSARNYKGTNECHGWIGLRFQAEPGSAPSDILLHVNLRDLSNILQQQAIGILGVNLIHAAHHRRSSMDDLLAALFESLSLSRIEVDHGELLGPAFEGWPAKEPELPMLARGLSRLVAVDANARFQPPSELLYKQAIVLLRDGPEETDLSRSQVMLRQAARMLQAETGGERAPLCLFEVVRSGAQEKADVASLVQRRQRLATLALPILFSSYREGDLLTEHLRRHTREPIRFVTEIGGLVQGLWTAARAGSEGGLLQLLGRFLGQGVKAYVFPTPAQEFDRMLDRFGIASDFCTRADGRQVSVENVGLSGAMRPLVAFLRESGGLVPAAATPPST